MLLISLSLTSLAILTRILANPLANVFQKQLTEQTADPLFITLTTYGFLSLVCLLFIPGSSLTGLSPTFWWNIMACAAFSVLGNVCLVQAMKIGDISVLGPINAYKAVVGMLIGLLWLGEYPTWAGVAGVGLIILGSYFVLRQPGQQPVFVLTLFNRADVRMRVVALLCAAVDAVFLKKAIMVSSSPVAFTYWCLFGFLMALLWVFLTERARYAEQLHVLWTQRATYLLLFLSVGLTQVSTTLAFKGTQVGYALALFQTSALLSVLFGYQFFGEQHVLSKLLGASVMAAGAALIVVFG